MTDDIRVIPSWKHVTFICFALCMLGFIAVVIVISLITLYLAPKTTVLIKDNTNDNEANAIKMVFATDFVGDSVYSIVNLDSLAQQFNQHLNSRSYGLGLRSVSFTPSINTVVTGINRRKKRQTRVPVSCDTKGAATNLVSEKGDKMVTEAFVDKKTTTCTDGICNPANLPITQSEIESKLDAKPVIFKVKLSNGTEIAITAIFCSVDSGSPSGPSPRRVDTHYHIVPDFYAKAVVEAGGDPSGGPSPTWSIEQSLDHMKQLGIETAIVSVTSPGTKIYENDTQKGRALARQINEFQYSMVQKYPKRFGHFAHLPPFTDVEGTLDEIDYVQSTLNPNGYIVFTSYGEDYQYIGHLLFQPIWARFNELKTVVFIHPSHAHITPNEYIIQPLIDYPQETTRAAADLVVTGTRALFPDVKIILSHAGGTLPYLAYRISMAGFAVNPPAPRNQQQILEDFRTFYFDTAISSSTPQLKALLDFIDPSKILFGSDDCYVPLPAAINITKALDKFFLEDEATKNESTWKAIVRGNAKRLFPDTVHD